MSSTLSRYWHTLRHLRPVQVYGRFRFRLSRPRLDHAVAPALRAPGGVWSMPARRRSCLVGPAEFSLLGELGSLAEVGWVGTQRDKLWRYNQHYFDDLNAQDAEDRTAWHSALLDDWVARNPPGTGDGWEPYPTSLRLVNWIKWALAGHALPQSCIQSMAVQVRWLARRLEFHLLGNHLVANAKALVFAGLFFEGRSADRWLARGLRILAQELPEQVLNDGGHFERSTMYHALALEDMLDLWNITRCFPEALSAAQRMQVAQWRWRIADMRSWLRDMCHPDGELAFFNDAALDVAPSMAELDGYAERLGFGPAGAARTLAWLNASGYARLESGAATALLDMAPIGPDYLPGHAHADTLSFELSLFGHRVLVNSGTSCYGVSEERLRQRGTAAHNTVVVNGADSSEVWSGFRVARRARPFGTTVKGDKVLFASCSHDGYQRLPGRPTHHRSWTLGNGFLEVHDEVSGHPERAEARFHFHPDIRIIPSESALTGAGVLPGGQRFAWQVQRGEARIEPTTWHPRFGESLPNNCLVIRLQHGKADLRLSWEGPASG